MLKLYLGNGIMKNYEELDLLYEEYDEANISSEKIRILKKILELDPDDIDSAHRLISFLPKAKRFDELLKLKESGKEIVNKIVSKSDDLYCNHETRPYIFVLYDIMMHYEQNNEVDKAYEIMQEISLLNEGDNLGIRFHIVAYYIGQNKLDELKRYIETNIDTYSVALRFGRLYLNELTKNKLNDFKSLFDEFPYLYSLLTREIKIKKEELNNIVDSIEFYSPNGFYDQLIFYKMLMTFLTPNVKKSLSKLVKSNGYFLKNSIFKFLPQTTKHILYTCVSYYDLGYDYFVKKLSKYRIKENEFLQVKDKLVKYQLIKIEEIKGKKCVTLNEASIVMLKQYLEKDFEEIYYLDNFYKSYIDYLKGKNR